MANSQIVVYLLLSALVTLIQDSQCKIYSRRQNVDPLKTVKLNEQEDVHSVLRRFRRDSSNDPQPKHNEHHLGEKDNGYNEAIVHWSGENSTVS